VVLHCARLVRARGFGAAADMFLAAWILVLLGPLSTARQKQWPETAQSLVGNGSADCSSSTIERLPEWLRRNIGTRRDADVAYTKLGNVRARSCADGTKLLSADRNTDYGRPLFTSTGPVP